MNELSQAVAQEKDKLLFELFKKYGYSRKKVMDAFTRDTVKLLVQGNRETYYIDGKELFTEEHGNQTGLYCSACGKWQKWLKKDEIRLFNHGVKVENASLLERLKARIEESAIKVSTVKAPHMVAVMTEGLESSVDT